MDNVETLAHLGWIARFGADEFKQVGEPGEPGTMLVTVMGAVRGPGVREVEIGTPMTALLDGAGASPGSAVLLGGYFGTWLDADATNAAVLSTAGLRPFGASLGCGLIAVIPGTRLAAQGHCPLQEVANVLEWLAANSAGQCGPCINGLPALAGTFQSVVAGDRGAKGEARLERWSAMIIGRGACKLPDGAVHFLNSARQVFGSHIRDHHRYGPCPPNKGRLLPTPNVEGWR